MSTFTEYMTVANHLSRYQKMTAAEPTVAQATKYFEANIGKITTPEKLVKDTRLFNYVMTAFGLNDMLYAKNLIKQVLQQGTLNSKALAHTLNNPKILALAKAFNFSLYGTMTTQTLAATSEVVSKYVMQTLEANEGKDSPGVELALYFQQNASKITDGYSILADKKLLSVVQTALGLSSYTSAQNIDRQAALFDKLLKYSDFQDGAKVKTFLQRFAAQYDLANGLSSSSDLVSAVSQPISSSYGATVGMSVSLLTTLQNFKLGGA
jgi:hypothetical protein